MPYSSKTFQSNLEALKARIQRSCEASGRSMDQVKLMAVTKRFSLEVAASAVENGLAVLGENRVQEGVEKIRQADFKARWELIGHLQSNKAQLAAQYFDCIQSVDSVKLAKRLDRFAGEAGKQLPVLLQVNTGKDPGKFGFSVDETEAAVNVILGLPSLLIEGLMTIAPLPPTVESATTAFNDLRTLRDHLVDKTGHPLPELSMGMSFDLESAIQAGSTCIRVGSALFGERPV
ncbi:MAG: YggS family pyridoxal phosphate-dependent enzyme [Verrucomicrobia bacterium]|nr:YggS family pyridoxal phosphate-dependent enzyme [Verrucomicrobiota bacterium]